MSWDRLVVAFSDIEMGVGDRFDDFPHTPFLAGMVDAYAERDVAVDLVFNGDTFDLLKTPVHGLWPTLVTEEIALHKMERVIEAHGGFFDALHRFLHRGRPSRVFFIAGNHDQELLFAAVARRIAKRIDAQDVHFPGLQVDIGDAHFEHGAQADPLFRVDPKHPFVPSPRGPVLALPWATVSLLEVALPMRELFFDLDRLKPRQRVFDLLPEVRDHLVGAFWRYWTQDGWRDWVRGHPVKRVSWTMLKEIAYRFSTNDANTHPGGVYRARLAAEEGPPLIVVGHIHNPSWWGTGARKLLYTGCFRDEFFIDQHGDVDPRPLPKVYAEVRMSGDRVVSSQLVEVEGPPAIPGMAPTSLMAVHKRVKPLLLSSEDRARMRDAESAQIADEKTGEVDDDPREQD